jgi:uncharacterized protein YndB with AHSA1/START domain
MRQVDTRAERIIGAPPDQVWAYRLDFMHLPEYNPSVPAVEQTGAGAPDGTGAAYRFDLMTGTHTSPIELRVTEAVRGELVAIEMDGALPARERFTLAPVTGSSDPSGCVATIALTLLIPDHFPATGDDALLAGGRAQIVGELDLMARILEAPAGSSSSGVVRG